MRSILSAPYDAVFLAMVIGQRGDLTPEVQQSFRASGTTHLLVVSGLNVSCIAIGVLWVWRTLLRLVRSWLPRSWCPGWRPTPIAAVLSIPPVLLCTVWWAGKCRPRAALMVGSYLLALMLQRTREPLHALVLAAALLVIEPAASRDLAFQLSFVAVASIFVVSETTVAVENSSNPYAVGGSTCGLPPRKQCGVFWDIADCWQCVSHRADVCDPGESAAGAPGWRTDAGRSRRPGPVGPLASLRPLGVCSLHPFAHLDRDDCRDCRGMAGSATLYRLPLGADAARVLWAVGELARLAPLALASAVCRAVHRVLAGAGWQYLETRTPQLRVTFLDVGSGDAIVVQAPGNHTLLIDGGGTYDGRFDTGMQLVAPFLWQHYVRHFDLMALTHMHPDHARGLVSILRLFPTQHLLTNGSPVTSDYVRDLLTVGQRWGTQQHTARTARVTGSGSAYR